MTTSTPPYTVTREQLIVVDVTAPLTTDQAVELARALADAAAPQPAGTTPAAESAGGATDPSKGPGAGA